MSQLLKQLEKKESYVIEKKDQDSNKIIIFTNNDEAYKIWLQENKKGFVFNHFGGTDASKDMNKINHSSSRYLLRKQDKGKRTTTLSKICSTNKAKLETYVSKLRGTSWFFCKSCFI